jgi:hypothetical protein
MKMAKATEKDIDAAGDCMGVLEDIAKGYYPSREGDEDPDPPHHFDEDDINHLRKFYRMVMNTLDASPGWPGRVIGGMCYVIMWDKNTIVDPDSKVLELHPHIRAALDAYKP